MIIRQDGSIGIEPDLHLCITALTPYLKHTMTGYNKYYETLDLFGEPYEELVLFFDNLKEKGTVLDIGCGQGRDSIAIANLGYKVTGIDNSNLGIKQMLDRAEKEDLDITGIVSDIYEYDNYSNYDIVLLDSMFHFQKRDLQKETGLIRKIAIELKAGGILCICIQDTGKKVSILKNTVKVTKVDWELLNDTTFFYEFEDKSSGHSSKTKYCMYIIKKK